MLKKTILIFGLILLSILLLSCGKKSTEKKDSSKSGPKRVPVEGYIVQMRQLQDKIDLTGRLQAIHSVDIVSEVSGRVLRINAEPGDYVTTRDTLLVVDDRIPYSRYRQARAQLQSARNNLEIARLNLQSDEQLYKNGDISDLQFKNSQLSVKNAQANLLSAQAGFSSAEKNYQDTRIRPPFNGEISRRYAELGAMTQPGMRLFHLVDRSLIKVVVGLPQDVIRMVQKNSRAAITVSALGSRVFRGTVQNISPQADLQTGTFPVEIRIKNDQQKSLKAGMTAKVRLLLNALREYLAIPEYAVVKQNGQPAVYRIFKGKAALTPVSIINTFGAAVAVDRGLSAGDTVVTSGIKQLGDSTSVWLEHVTRRLD